jgi:hypothetical protein
VGVIKPHKSLRGAESEKRGVDRLLFLLCGGGFSGFEQFIDGFILPEGLLPFRIIEWLFADQSDKFLGFDKAELFPECLYAEFSYHRIE